MTYQEKLRTPQWQKKRLAIFDRDEWKCTRCADNFTTLHVHHLYYSAGADPWDYPDRALVTLCELCHQKVEFMKWVARVGIVQLKKLDFPPEDVKEVLDLVYRRVYLNPHKESALHYIEDIKKLLQDG